MLVKRTMERHIVFLSLILIFVAILSTEVRADLYHFGAISDNSGVSGLMATQLSLEVTPYGSDQVLFKFQNNIAPFAVSSPEDGIIGSLFFEDGALLGIASIIDDPLNTANPVDFETPLNPASKNFPEGGTLSSPFQTTAHFWSTNVGTIANGVNPGEQVGIVFDLLNNNTFGDVITAINSGFTSSDPSVYDKKGNLIYPGTTLRIGVHVQNLPGYDKDGNWTQTDGSDSFILTPVPASVVIGMLGICVAGLKLRKFA
ncbi:MAG: hypothetical protein GY845_12345 [Planctomycetes bacterium]|nr:hypothetical protein [Planctomycetota bacterium]